jgi:TP901 family phage tail tape measure protein
VPLEIRARIALEVAKFQANAKVVAGQFKAMGTSAERFQNNVDHYAKRSLDRTKGLGVQRIQDASKTGQAILAVEKKLADDRYSVIMAGVQKANKAKSKLELDAVRNRGGITAGTNVGRPLPVTNNLTAEQRKETERYHAWWIQAHRQAVGQQVKDAYAAMRSTNAAYLARVKEQNAANAKAAKERIALESAAARKAAQQQLTESVKAYAYRTAYDIRYLAGKVAREIAAAKEAARAQRQGMTDRFASKDFERNLASTRYALYDIGNRFLAFGVAVEAAVFQSIKAFADFETAFTAVERTSGLTGNALDDMRTKLIEISTTIPVAFADVSKVATLGAQMGIAADSLDEFTNTVVKFATITGISVEETAMSFGRLAQMMDVPVSKFENLSAAVAFTGVNSVATDTEILRMSESIAASSNQAGFAADEVIGFAAALASLKVRPEEARGVLVRLFREIDLSVSSGGKSLNDFAKVVGSTSAEAANLWKQDPSQFVQSFLQGAQATGQLNQVITDLGITNTRELNVIQRLAGNMDVLKSSLADSREQYVLGTYAQEAYGKVADDLNSKLTVMQNSFAALQAKMGAGLGEALKPFVDIISGVLKAIGSLPTPLLAATTMVAAIVGGFIILKGVMALGIAGLFAMQLAMKSLGTAAGGAAINLATLRAAMTAVTGQAGIAAGVMQFFGLSMTKAAGGARILQLSLGVIGAALLVFTAVASVMSATEEASKNAGKAMFDAAGGAEALSAAIEKDTAAGAAESFRAISESVKDLTQEEKDAKEAALEAAEAREKEKAGVTGSTEALEIAQKALADFRKETDAASEAIDANTVLLGKNTQELILNALTKYGEGEGKDFWSQLAQIDPGTEGVLTQLGFSAAEMVAEGMSEGGETAEQYATRFVTAVNTLGNVLEGSPMAVLEAYQKQLKDLGFDLTIPQIQEMAKNLELTGGAVAQSTVFLVDAGKATDGFVKQSEAAVKASQIKAQAFTAAGLSAEGEGTEVEALSDALDRYVTAATAVANVGVYDSFANLAEAMQGIKGEIDVLTEDGRNAIGAWSSFMKAAIDNAVANDTGFIGSVQTMAAGIYALGQEGINTGLQFQQMKQYIITSLAATHPSLKTFAATLTTAMDTESLIKMVDAQLLVMQSSASMGAFMGKNGAANAAAFSAQLKSLQDLRNSLTTSGDTASKFASVYADALDDSAKSSNKAKTALEKLLEKINSAFKFTNAFVSLRSSLASLGDSLNENGRTFDSFSEKGRSNISALQSTIKELAEKSGGNTQKFANDLASLRKTLADAGVGASGLGIVDKVLKEIGKTGKVSKKSVEEFTKALGKVSKQEVSLAKIVEAIRNIASESKEAFDANFAYADSIDNITLGWQAMADAQKEAADRISDLRDEALEAAASIDEVKLSIDEANASIAEMSAGRSKLEYQLQIAIKYGDALRAQEIRAQIASTDADIAKERNNIAKANQDILDSQSRVNEINTEVTRGKTATEIINENRGLRDMAGSYAEMTAFMLMNAKEGTDLNKVVTDQVAAFKANAIAMGYTQTQADAVAAKLRDSLLPQIDAVKQAKLDLGITIDTTKATTILDSFVKDADIKLKAVKPFDLKTNTDKAKKDVSDAVTAINSKIALIKDKTVTVTTVYNSTGGSALGVIKRASGGLVTGPGTATSDSIAARLSNGEYVVKTAAVKHYGVDFMNALNNMSLQGASMGAPSISVAGSQTVYLSTEDRQLLRAAMDRPIALYTDNAIIAKSANDGNSMLAQRGIR